ncbi:RCC1/BLIP-II [Karstenula rhodostoma CBS 690.94]|uniref:RCC1/BLIP-II n=1 Tax=Karstenula rhodostoma CBS 690.94 TaxID=1392251 RepID=A0A9P4UAZ1_9PLEO|nr:RCC1/BLIP-II [Karstenula rhodostoma CBS 690.94]
MPYRLYVFGSNGEGQLGIQAEEIVQTPTIAHSWPEEKGISAVCGGDNHTLIIASDGSLHHAGSAEKLQLGPVPSGQPRIDHFEISDKMGVTLCAAACESSAYIRNEVPDMPGNTTATTILVEGTSRWGEGTFAENVLPHTVIDFAAGNWHYVAILSNGDVFGWGKSRLDQLGPKLSAQQRITEPTLIEESIPFRPVKVVCGKEFTYLASDPSTGEHYLLGRDKFSLRSSMPANIKGWKQIGATWHAVFVLHEDGSLTAWGKDNMWALLPSKLPLIEQIAVGSEHVLALTRDGRLISWGWGKHGNCGNLESLGDKVKNDMVSGFWNEIEIPGTIKFFGAGFCTSFVLTAIVEE